jgi:16S rRNA processing protein RimM
MEESFVIVGKILKVHGVKGEMKCSIIPAAEKDVMKQPYLLLLHNRQKIPYFIEYIRGAGTAILKLEEINSPEEARLHINKDIFLKSTQLTKGTEKRVLQADTTAFSFLEGYAILDENLGDLGTIREILSLPMQQMAVIDYGSKEILMPLHEQFVLKIDRKAKVMHTSIPDGLLDL